MRDYDGAADDESEHIHVCATVADYSSGDGAEPSRACVYVPCVYLQDCQPSMKRSWGQLGFYDETCAGVVWYVRDVYAARDSLCANPTGEPVMRIFAVWNRRTGFV